MKMDRTHLLLDPLDYFGELLLVRKIADVRIDIVCATSAPKHPESSERLTPIRDVLLPINHNDRNSHHPERLHDHPPNPPRASSDDDNLRVPV